MRHISAQASSGTAKRASLMKETQVARGFLHPSRTVPVSEVNLAPHDGHLHRRTPEGSKPSLQAGPDPHRGQRDDGWYSSAASASVPKPTSSRSLRSSTASDSRSSSPGVSDPTSPAYGFACFMAACPIRPNAHPEGLSPNKDPGGRSG